MVVVQFTPHERDQEQHFAQSVNILVPPAMKEITACFLFAPHDQDQFVDELNLRVMKDIVDVMRVFLREGTPPDHPLERMLEQVGGLLPHQVMEKVVKVI